MQDQATVNSLRNTKSGSLGLQTTEQIRYPIIILPTRPPTLMQQITVDFQLSQNEDSKDSNKLHIRKNNSSNNKKKFDPKTDSLHEIQNH